MGAITVKGKELPVNFGLKTINDYAELTGKDFEDVLNAMQAGVKIKDLITLAMIGLNNGARRANIETRYNETDVWDMADDDPSFLTQVGEQFAKAISPDMEKLGSTEKKPKRPAAGKANRNG